MAVTFKKKKNGYLIMLLVKSRSWYNVSHSNEILAETFQNMNASPIMVIPAKDYG